MCEQTRKAVRKISGHFLLLGAFLMCAILMISVYTLQADWKSDNKMAKELVAALNQTGTGIMQINSNAVISGWNPAMEDITGYRRVDAIGRPLSFLMPSEMSHQHDVWARDALRAYTTANSHRVVILTAPIITKDGKTVSVRVRAYIVPGQHTGVALVDKDDAVIPHSDKH